VYGRFKNGGKMNFKTNYNHSKRGIPGPAFFYNPYSGERSKDQTVFSQLNYMQQLNRLFDFQINAKFSSSSNDYTDKNNKYPDGLLKALYSQKEYYLNMTWLYTVSENLSFSWANDGVYGNFSNSFDYCPFPSRTTWLSALSGKYEVSHFTLTGSLLSNITEDKVKTGNSPKSDFHLSPYMGLSLKPAEALPVRLRGYYKNTYRLPTFGDMYLSPVTNENLQPENANQFNLGATFAAFLTDMMPFLSISGDIYNNRIKNKIIALPRSSMFIWSVQNYGKVDIKGLDLNLNMQFQFHPKLACRLSGAYTYQQVLDKTDKDSHIYDQQLPYTPRHIASGTIRIETPWVDLNYTLLYCGKRYYERINRPEYQMKRYADHGISLSKTIRRKSDQWLITVECLNVLNESYEVVRSFPMPGRSFRIGVKYNYEL
jgi:outer membrane cobalamin receptor